MTEQPNFDINSLGGTIEPYEGGFRFFIPGDLVERDHVDVNVLYTDNVVYENEWLANQAALKHLGEHYE